MLSTWSSVDVYSLEDGRMHTIKQLTGSNVKPKKPVMMGKHRLYFITEDKTCKLTACDLESGKQLYSKVLGRDGTLKDFAILYGGPSNSEQLVALEQRPDASNLHIINGTDGMIFQELKIDLLESPYIAISPSRKEFALVSHRRIAGADHEIRSQRFSRGHNRIFSSRGIEQFRIQERYNQELGKHACDPFRYLVASLHPDYEIPEIRGVDPAVPPGAEGDRPRYLSKCELAKVFRDNIKKEFRREVTLPPRYAHHKARRPFPGVDGRYNPAEMRFVDGDRLLYRVKPHFGTDVYYLFDFGLRIREKKGD
ncbi:uncharacterized protein BDV14DRAFT_180580 [Aspergillus stella-maris]|uniref:uncharacterized protein n=1 Tax=Aspergillus stella-maris TaxID=1810926 RepID=UPI003CCDDD22